MGSNRGALGFVIIVLLIGSAIVGALFLSPIIGKVRAPKTHQWILDNLEVIDQRWPDAALDEKLVDYGIRTWGKPLQVILSEFQDEEDFHQTTWLFQRWGDTEVVLTIWGPGLDGKTHYLEMAQLGYGPFKVYLDGEEKLFLYQEGQNPADSEAHMVGWFEILIESGS